MTDKILAELRALSPNLKNCIIRGITLERSRKIVTVNITADAAFTHGDKAMALSVIGKYVPKYFDCAVEITKLSPDSDMVKRKISEIISSCNKAVAATLSEGDIKVIKTEDGFEYTVAVSPSLCRSDICEKINKQLTEIYCGAFSGKCVPSDK
ncbi:MAG: hypothetical protein HDP34_03705, partial [Clostridia bacterium]|nr:hypothetical protein [Clostridia bacterium]